MKKNKEDKKTELIMITPFDTRALEDLNKTSIASPR